jgi:hypothetical protein
VTGRAIAVGAPDEQPEPGALPRQIDVGTLAVFKKDSAGKGWVRDISVRMPAEPSVPFTRFALSGNLLALAGFRRAPDGGFVKIFDLTEAP